MTMTLTVIAGAVLGALAVAAARLLAPMTQRLVYAVLLWLAAGVYLALALGLGSLSAILLELLGLGLFGGAAVIGFRSRLWVLAAGWLLHPLWDLGLHDTSAHAPLWYAYLCVGFDLAVGVGIVMHYRQLIRRKPPLAKAAQGR